MTKFSVAITLTILSFLGMAFGQIPSVPGTPTIPGTGGTKKGPDRPVSTKLRNCREVRFEYTNGTEDPINVHKVKYFSSLRNQWYEEVLKNNSCLPGKVCQTSSGRNGSSKPSMLPDQLDMSITEIKFLYKIYDPRRFPVRYSKMMESAAFEPNQPTCEDGKIYGNGQSWTIREAKPGAAVAGQRGTAELNPAVTPTNGTGNQRRKRIRRKTP